ncbi:MAG: hypothetical protein MHM6MM_000097 [Cercozoa sp. M6MM]
MIEEASASPPEQAATVAADTEAERSIESSASLVVHTGSTTSAAQDETKENVEPNAVEESKKRVQNGDSREIASDSQRKPLPEKECESKVAAAAPGDQEPKEEVNDNEDDEDYISEEEEVSEPVKKPKKSTEKQKQKSVVAKVGRGGRRWSRKEIAVLTSFAKQNPSVHFTLKKEVKELMKMLPARRWSSIYHKHSKIRNPPKSRATPKSVPLSDDVRGSSVRQAEKLSQLTLTSAKKKKKNASSVAPRSEASHKSGKGMWRAEEDAALEEFMTARLWQPLPTNPIPELSAKIPNRSWKAIVSRSYRMRRLNCIDPVGDTDNVVPRKRSRPAKKPKPTSTEDSSDTSVRPASSSSSFSEDEFSEALEPAPKRLCEKEPKPRYEEPDCALSASLKRCECELWTLFAAKTTLQKYAPNIGIPSKELSDLEKPLMQAMRHVSAVRRRREAFKPCQSACETLRKTAREQKKKLRETETVGVDTVSSAAWQAALERDSALSVALSVSRLVDFAVLDGQLKFNSGED